MAGGSSLLDAINTFTNPSGDPNQNTQPPMSNDPNQGAPAGPPDTSDMPVRGRQTPNFPGVSNSRADLDINQQEDAASSNQARMNGGMWANLLKNLLVGVAGGMSVDPHKAYEAPQAAMSALQNMNQQQTNNAQAQQRLDMDTQSHQYQMAHMQLSLAKINQDLEQMPQSKQESYENEFRSTIIAPLYKDFPEMLQKEGSNDGGDFYDLREEAMRMNKQENTMDYVVGPSMTNQKGYAIYKMPHSRTQEDESVDLGDNQKVTIPKGTPISTRNQLMMIAAQKKVSNDLQQSIQAQKSTTATNVAQIHANATQNAAETHANATTNAAQIRANSANNGNTITKDQKTFKKDADDLAKTEGTYNMFQSVLDDINSGKDITGAQSVVSLFNAIGISATPLKGQGFRINSNTIQEHIQARGLDQSLYQKLLSLKNGDVITPQQVKDYASLATQARKDAYINKINEVRNFGIDPSFLLPRGNGRHVDPNTAQIFVAAADGNNDAARKSAAAKGWIF